MPACYKVQAAKALSGPAQDPDAAAADGGTMLAVGCAKTLPEHLGLGAKTAVVATHFRMMTEGLLHQVRPDCVVAPLLSPDFDAADLGLILTGLRYRGRLYVLAPILPRPELVEAELRRLCRGFEVTLVTRH